MKKLKSVNNKNGFSLISILFAVGLMAGIMLVVVSLMSNLSKEGSRIEYQASLTSLHNLGIQRASSRDLYVAQIQGTLNTPAFKGCLEGRGTNCKTIYEVWTAFESDRNSSSGASITSGLNGYFSLSNGYCGTVATSDCPIERRVEYRFQCPTEQKCNGIEARVETSVRKVGAAQNVVLASHKNTIPLSLTSIDALVASPTTCSGDQVFLSFDPITGVIKCGNPELSNITPINIGAQNIACTTIPVAGLAAEDDVLDLGLSSTELLAEGESPLCATAPLFSSGDLEITECPDGSPLIPGETCPGRCPDGSLQIEGTACPAVCEDGTLVPDDGVCSILCDDGSVVAAGGTCPQYCSDGSLKPAGGACPPAVVDTCPNGAPKPADGYCQRCPNGQPKIPGRSCVSSPPVHPRRTASRSSSGSSSISVRGLKNGTFQLKIGGKLYKNLKAADLKKIFGGKALSEVTKKNKDKKWTSLKLKDVKNKTVRKSIQNKVSVKKMKSIVAKAGKSSKSSGGGSKKKSSSGGRRR